MKGAIVSAIRRETLLTIVLALALNLPLSAQDSTAVGELAQGSVSRISGVVTDAETGRPVAAASVYVDGTRWGGLTNTRGEFSFQVPRPGRYNLVVTLVGYSRLSRQFTVEPGREHEVQLQIQPEVILLEGFVVEGEAGIENREDQILAQRRSAVAIQDGIGSEAISRTGSSDAADAVAKMTGASISDGKYVYVRGLGERYSNTSLNGSELPSADPYRRAVQMDLFPSNLLDRIILVKTFTPDRPGNFSGGSVDIWTKRFPREFTFNYSSSVSYNPQVSFKDGFLTYPGGKTDWLGFDDGSRSLPDVFKDPSVRIPDIGSAYNNLENALELDRLTKSFNSVMAPSTGKGPMNYGWSLSSGNNVKIAGRELGMLGTLTYNRSASFHDNGQVGRWILHGHVDQVDELSNHFLLSDTRSSDKVLWGGLLNLSYELSDDHQVGFNYMYNHSGEQLARYQSGTFPRDLDPESVYETRSLGYTERSLGSFQLRGEHDIQPLRNLHFEWTGSHSSTYQDEPDIRFFTNNYTVRTRESGIDTLYSIRPSLYPFPNRYFRKLNEDNTNLDLQFALPFKQWSGLHSRFKFGGAWNATERSFRERSFQFRQTTSIRFDGDDHAFFQPENLGLVDSNGGRYRFGHYVLDNSEARGNYDGTQDIYAGFLMAEVPLTRRWQLIGGARLESTRMEVASHDSTLARGLIDENDILPSVNMIYLMRDNVNLRLAYGRTLARPNFREMAPYASFDFVGDMFFIGNANLKRTLIDNYDIRWEWFYGPGELLAVSGFYKNFTNPIERVIMTINGEVQYQNVDEAKVFGLELEGRAKLIRLHEALGRFSLGGNLTLSKSDVAISPDELEVIRSINPYHSSHRDLQGQPGYVLNLDLSYDNPEFGLLASLLYNVIGPRIAEVSLGGTPNVYEQPAAMLDFTLKQRIWGGYSLKFGAANLLDTPVRRVHRYKDGKFVQQEYRIGRAYSLGVNFDLK